MNENDAVLDRSAVAQSPAAIRGGASVCGAVCRSGEGGIGEAASDTSGAESEAQCDGVRPRPHGRELSIVRATSGSSPEATNHDRRCLCGVRHYGIGVMVPPRPKGVAEEEALTHPFAVGDAYAGMMVTPSVKLVRPLGEGGMGSVWVAHHLSLRTDVVVKFISSDLKDSAEAHERFSREAAAAAQVKSPHVVQTFDHGITAGNVPYIVMELLEGHDLGKALDDRGKLSREIVVEIVAQLSRALERAHERGIVHRDIKPGNIFLCDQGGGEIFVKLLDFGIAKGVEMPHVDSTTKTGAMIGSPFYMSPEQVLGSKNIDHRSDIWSVGVLAFEALTGAKPFDAETMGGLAIKIHSEPLPLPTSIDPTLPAAVDAWFQRACARSAAERFGSAREAAEALAGAMGGRMPKSLDAPRIHTGPADGARRQPSLVVGAATDAGLTRSAAPKKTRDRYLVLAAIVVIGLPVGYGVVTAFKPTASGAARTGIAQSASLTGSAIEPDRHVVSAPPAPVSAPLPEPATAAAPIASVLPQAHPKVSGAGRGAHPKEPPLPATVPSATPPPPPPTSTSHDIF